MLQTLLGIIIGGLISAFLAHYYFRRSRRKSLTPYITLSSNVFSGIDEDDRKRMRFEYQGREIRDLHQIEFLIGNDGELAISQCIEPLTLKLPKDVEILDASILYKNPADLEVDIVEGENLHTPQVQFAFPLLNRWEFFVVKLLLSERVVIKDCHFSITTDDLPRVLRPRWLPSEAAQKGRLKADWSFLVMAGVFISIALVISAPLMLLRPYRLDLFLLPWDSFRPSLLSIVVIPTLILVAGLSILFGLLCLVVFILDPFMSHIPHFHLPEAIVSRAYNFTYGDMRRLRGQKRQMVLGNKIMEDEEEI